MEILLLTGLCIFFAGISILLGLFCYRLQKKKTQLTEERGILQGRLEGYEREALAKETFKKEVQNEFAVLAERIFDEKGKKFSETGKILLDPLREQIKDFQIRVNTVHDQNVKANTSLLAKINEVQSLNQQLSTDAKQLTTALKGESQSRGAWGEMVLEKTLELSGLEKGREYEVQSSFRNAEDKLLRPDAVIHLPRNRDVVVDSKVALIHYTEGIDKKETSERERYLKEHAKAMKKHIQELGGKYSKVPGLHTLEATLLFVPIEGALAEGLRFDPSLQEEAISRGIILVGPSTLWLALKCIHHVWSTELRERNIDKVTQEVSSFLEKISAFSGDLEDIGKHLGRAQESYDKSHSKLISGRGSVVGRAQKIQKLGSFHTKKNLPSTESTRAENM